MEILTRAVKVLRDGLRQLAGASQRGGAGRPSSVRGARARPAVCSLRLGREGSRDALAAQDDPQEARLARARARCTVPYWSGLYHTIHEP